MTIERMEEQLGILRGKKEKFNADIDRRIDALEKEHELALAAQTQKIFAKHRLDPDELNKLKFASKEQLKRVLEFIDSEIQEPSKPAAKPDNKNEEENEDHAKEVTT